MCRAVCITGVDMGYIYLDVLGGARLGSLAVLGTYHIKSWGKGDETISVGQAW